MAQSPDFCLNMTDGDATHVPTPTQINNGFGSAVNYGLVRQGLEISARSMIAEKNRLKQPHEAVERVEKGE